MAGLAAQAGLVLRLAALRAELEARHAELVSRAGDLERRGIGSSPLRTPSAVAWSGTSTTGPSSTWWL